MLPRECRRELLTWYSTRIGVIVMVLDGTEAGEGVACVVRVLVSFDRQFKVYG